MVIRMKINKVINGAGFFGAPSDGTQSMIALKNTNNIFPQFRINFRAGGVAANFDVGTFKYVIGKTYTVGVRYNGSLVDVWVDGVLIGSQAASGAFGTTSQNWSINTVAGGTKGALDVFFARSWKTALSDSDFVLAMNGVIVPASILDMRFLEGTGTMVDSANNATMSIANAPVWFPYGRKIAQDLPNALSFIGATPTATFGSESGVLDITGNKLTLGMRVKFGIGQVDFSTYINKDKWGFKSRSASGGKGVYMFVNTGSESGATTIAPNGLLEDNRWHDIVMTYDGSLGSGNIKTFVDAIQNATADKTGNLVTSSGKLRIDSSSNNLIQICDLFVCNLPMTIDEIREWHFSGGISNLGLVGRWKMQEGSGTLLTDETGNGNGAVTSPSWITLGPSKKRSIA